MSVGLSACTSQNPYVQTSGYIPRHVIKQARHFGLAREVSWSIKAKFHHAIWFEVGSKLVADLQRDKIGPSI